MLHLIKRAIKAISIATMLGLFAFTGCKDHRIDEPTTPPTPKVHVDVPGAHIGLEGQPDPVVPGAGEIDVRVTPGDVKVNVDGEPLGERIRERREERQEATP